MRALVLSYHSHNVFGHEYHNNDHVAFPQDLNIIHRAGAKIIPLMDLVKMHGGAQTGAYEDDAQTYVALSFDDGPLFDFQDFMHPTYGNQTSFYHQMRQFQIEHGVNAQPGLSSTSFVIASPHARRAMATSPECGYTFLDSNWLGDDWWARAAKTELMSIATHSWDHVHPVVPDVALISSVRGDFTKVESLSEATAQIQRAVKFIAEKTAGLSVPLFAFPYGHYNRFLTEDYLPNYAFDHGLHAAFGADGKAITASDSRWCLSRFICGFHWKSAAELEAMLDP